jgi:hypothetical protein
MWTWKGIGHLGLLIALLALTGALLAWVAPGLLERWASEERPTATLQVFSREPRILFDNSSFDAEADFRRYQKVLIALLKSRLVILTALQNPEIAQFPAIRTDPDPVAWLKENIEAGFKGDSEILEISLKRGIGISREAEARLINALTDAFVDEALNVELNRRTSRYDMLKDLSRKYAASIKDRREKIRSVADSTSSEDSLRRETLSGLYHDLRMQQVDLRLERAVAESALETQKKESRTGAQLGHKEVSHLENGLEILRVKEKVLQDELVELEKQKKAADRDARKVTEFPEELKAMEDTHYKLAAEIQALEVELNAPRRVVKIERAEASRTP